MKKIIFALLFVACFVSVSFAQTDQVTLTTYYPAPFGMYQEMRVMGKLGVGTTNPTDAVEVVGGTSVTPEVVSIKNDGGGQALLKFDSPTKAATTNIGMIFDVHGGQTGTLQYNQMYGFGILGGNVGVGTSFPSSRLTVDDGSGAYAPAGSDPVGVFMTGTKNKPALSVISADSVGAVTPNAGNVGLYAYGTDYAGYFNVGKTYFADNVGIGVTNPQVKLHAENSSGAVALLNQTGSSSGDYALAVAQNATFSKGAMVGQGGVFISTPTAGSYGVYQAGSNADNYFAGDVGIGTASPAGKLHVENAGSQETVWIKSSDATGSSGVTFAAGSTNDRYTLFKNQNNMYLVRYRNGTGQGDSTFLTIEDQGNPNGAFVGIGAADPIARLDVGGGVKIGSTTDSCTASRAGTLKFNPAETFGCVAGPSYTTSTLRLCARNSSGTWGWYQVAGSWNKVCSGAYPD